MMLFDHGLQPQLPALTKLCDLLPKLPVWLGFPTCKMGNERQLEPMMGNVKALWLTEDSVGVSGKVRDNPPPEVRGARSPVWVPWFYPPISQATGTVLYQKSHGSHVRPTSYPDVKFDGRQSRACCHARWRPSHRSSPAASGHTVP